MKSSAVMVKILMLLVLPVIFGFFSSSVSLVKDGVVAIDKTTTVGKAFDNYKYFKSKDWSEFKDTQGRLLVEFVGKLDFDGFFDDPTFDKETVVSVKKWINEVYLPTKPNKKIDDFVIKLQFLISADGKSFSIGASQISYGSEVICSDCSKDIVESVYRNVFIGSARFPIVQGYARFLKNNKEKELDEDRRSAESRFDLYKNKIVDRFFKDITGSYVLTEEGFGQTYINIKSITTTSMLVNVRKNTEEWKDVSIPVKYLFPESSDEASVMQKFRILSEDLKIDKRQILITIMRGPVRILDRVYDTPVVVMLDSKVLNKNIEGAKKSGDEKGLSKIDSGNKPRIVDGDIYKIPGSIGQEDPKIVMRKEGDKLYLQVCAAAYGQEPESCLYSIAENYKHQAFFRIVDRESSCVQYFKVTPGSIQFEPDNCAAGAHREFQPGAYKYTSKRLDIDLSNFDANSFVEYSK